MSKQLTRRGLFGLLRPRPRAQAPAHVSGQASGAADTTPFSLEDFYRRRAAAGAAHAPLPSFTPRADLDTRDLATSNTGVPDLVLQRKKS